MRILRLADPDARARSRTPLGESLIQLGTSQPTGRQPDAQADPENVKTWHDRWDENQEQITRRLALIEVELDRLLGPGPESLQLAVFQGDGETVRDSRTD